jgi:hypothetical protein
MPRGPDFGPQWFIVGQEVNDSRPSGGIRWIDNATLVNVVSRI